MSSWKPYKIYPAFLDSMVVMSNYSYLRLVCAITLICSLFSLAAHAQQSALDKVLSTDDARHLFSRTGFGYSLTQHDQVEGLTRREAIDVVMQGFNTQPALDMPAWVMGDAPYHWAKRDMDRTQRVQFERDRDQELAQLRQWWVGEMLQTPSPQTERLVLFWHDLMATSYQGVNYQSMAMARQNVMFRQFGLSTFGDLLKSLIRDPAMLNYLDNENSKKQSPNENLARELLERFSMGEGNFTEQTVKEAARALTGYSVSHDYNLSFRFETWKHDKGAKKLFGQTGNFNGDDLVDLILAQDATAEFVAVKFWNLLVSDAQPQAFDIEPLAAQLRSTDYDLAQLYQSILLSDAFWQLSNRIARVKSPITLQVAIARSLEYPKLHWQKIPVTSASLGMSLFAPPNVSGWNEGTAYTTAGRLKQRKGIVELLLGLDQQGQSIAPSTMANTMQPGMAGSMMMAAGLSVTMAAEDYHGPVQYRLELYNNSKLLWQSAQLDWMDGHDTLQFGRIGDMSNMPWQQKVFTPAPELIEQANKVRLHFLNDKAGPDGDRNLYVRGVSIADTYFAANTGLQQSACVPRNPADAGNLYCNGYVEIPVNTDEPSALSRSNESYQVGNVRVRWANINKKKDKKRLELTLEGVQAPGQTWRNISVALYGEGATRTDMRIDTYSCWPDCFTTVADCLWLDELDGITRTWVFPLNDDHQCHYQSLNDQEQRLVDAIWVSLPDFVEHAATIEDDRRYENALAKWLQYLKKQKSQISNSRYAQSGNQFLINPAVLKNAKPPALVQAPDVLIHTHEQLRDQLNQRGLDVFDLLMPGVNANEFPQLEATRGQSIQQRLTVYSQHAISQLY